MNDTPLNALIEQLQKDAANGITLPDEKALYLHVEKALYLRGKEYVIAKAPIFTKAILNLPFYHDTH